MNAMLIAEKMQWTMKQVSQNILELGQLGLHRLTPTQRRKLSLLIEWEVLGK